VNRPKFRRRLLVDSINTDLFGKPYVTLRGGVNQFMEPKFKLDSTHRNYAAGFQQGMRISLICKVRGDVAKRRRCPTSVRPQTDHAGKRQ
jgi:hypothetical protein